MDLSPFSMPVIASGVTVSGLLVVFVALVGLWGIVAVFGKVVGGLANKPTPPPAPPKAAPAPKAATPAPAPAAPAAPAPAAPAPAPVAVLSAPAGGTEDEFIAALAGAVAASSPMQASDEVIAVITAAISATNGGVPFQICSVRQSRQTRPVWAQAGLMQNTQPF